MNRLVIAIILLFCFAQAFAQLPPPVPKEKRSKIDAERTGTHDGANIRTEFQNYGMVGNYPPDPVNVDLSVFHSVEVPKGSGMNYSDGITPFVLAKIVQRNGNVAWIMETGFRERQAESPYTNRVMRFEPRPGYFQADPNVNKGRSPAISNDPRTWPDSWPDKENDSFDPGWRGSWNGYFGKRPNADQESYMVMDDDYYDAWDYYPDDRDQTRRGLGLRVEVRGFQWANPQAQNVIFWHYDITSEATVDYVENIIFGLYFDSGVGGSQLSCDGIFESDDDNASYDDSEGLDLVFTWDKRGKGNDLSGNCGVNGYLGYAYLETPGKPFDTMDNDDDGITNERRDSGPGELIEGQDQIEAAVRARYDVAKYNAYFTDFKSRPAYRAARWWTGDEDLDWVAELHDTGGDGVFGTGDPGEGDLIPTAGESNFDRTDLHESDQIGLTGFKMNRIRSLGGAETDNIVFYDDIRHWPQTLYDKFTNPIESERYDVPVALDYNIGFLFASGPFTLRSGQTERFSLALAYGADLIDLRETVKVVQRIYNGNYQFATPPSLPTVTAESGDGYVRLSWDDLAERGADPVTLENDFEGYRIYRSTDPDFRDPRVIITGRGTGPIGNGKPLVQFDLNNGRRGYSQQVVEGVAYFLGTDSGLRHTFTDTTAVNGQLYYYAVCSYDRGSDSLDFYPSESAISVSRTPRGGTILPKNVVAVRANPKVHGFVPATASPATHIAGTGVGTVAVSVVNSNLVPDNHVYNLQFRTNGVDSIRAAFYDLIDSTAGKVVFSGGYDMNGVGNGQVGDGLLPITTTLPTVAPNPEQSGLIAASNTNVLIKIAFQNAVNPANPKYQNVRLINYRRPGYPNDLTITFSDAFVDTSVSFGAGRGPRPAKFRVVAHTPQGDMRMRFGFVDFDRDGTLSRADEYIGIVTEFPQDPALSAAERETWRVQLDTTGQSQRGPIVPPREGDVYHLVLDLPLGNDDVFSFKTTAQFLDAQKAQAEATQEPYVVPNPYVGSASFEAERFAISGRGERRMEFRGVAQNATVRIYTVRGELVRTLQHDGSNDGFVAWDLRTKDNLEVAPGLYIFHVDGGGNSEHVGKFAIIK